MQPSTFFGFALTLVAGMTLARPSEMPAPFASVAAVQVSHADTGLIKAQADGRRKKPYDEEYGDFLDKEDNDPNYKDGDWYENVKGEICRATLHYCRHHWNGGRGHKYAWRLSSGH